MATSRARAAVDLPLPAKSSHAPGFARHWRRLSTYDQRALLRLGAWRWPLVTRIMRGFTYAGDPSSWILVGLGLASSGRHGRRYARLLAISAGLATGATQALKRTCCRPRPSTAGLAGFIALAEDPDAFSFPSGHAAGAFAAAAALGGGGGPMSSVLGLHALGIAVSRVYLGAHYPLDVVAGALIGTLAGLTTRWALGK